MFNINRPVFQGRRRTEDTLGLPRILYARQLNDNAACTLLLNDGFCDTEFVNAISQGQDILLQGKQLGLAHFLLAWTHQHTGLAGCFRFFHDQCRETLSQY